MRQFLSAVSLVVPEYDEAIAFYVGVLGFTLEEDTPLSDTKRWVVIAPPGAGPTDCRLLLARAANDQQRAAIGNQTGGRVFLFLKTDDVDRDVARLTKAGVTFCEPAPREEEFGRVIVFEDPFGSRWDLIQPKNRIPS